MKFLRWVLPCLMLIPATRGVEAQTIISGSIRDAADGKPLPFCNVTIAGSSRGTLSNSEGVYRILADPAKDTVVYSYMGYKTLKIKASKAADRPDVYLKPMGIALGGVTVHASEGYLYNLLEKCRRNLKKDKSYAESKAYFGLDTRIGDQTAEILECYYNAYFRGTEPEELKMKNGRLGLAIIGSRVYNSWETSIVMTRFSLTDDNGLFPKMPLQTGSSEMKKLFRLKLVYEDSSMCQVSFEPFAPSQALFSGNIWVDKKASLPLKIELGCRKCEPHPFISIIEDSVKNVNLNMIIAFKIQSGLALADYYAFDYSLTYVTGSGKGRIADVQLQDMSRVINTRCLLYYYDYGNPFLLPYFNYSSDVGDYEKLSMIPYNVDFWERNQAMQLTGKQKENLGLFALQGYLINFDKGNYGKDFCKALNNDKHGYFMPYTFWSPEKRINLARGLPQTEPYPAEKINGQIPEDLYKLKIQLLLDMNPVGDSLRCRTYTVFDDVQTYYHLPSLPITPVFLNICFDLCEIERRTLQKRLDSRNWPAAQVDSLYRVHAQKMDETCRKYLSEVETGKNFRALEKWNKVVKEALGIDNFEIYKVEEL